MKKSIASIVLISVLLGNSSFVANAEGWPYKHELTHNNIKIKHVPFWLFEEDNSAPNFTMVEGSPIESIQANTNISTEVIHGDVLTTEANSEQDSFLNTLFGNDFMGKEEDKSLELEEKKSSESNESDNFLDMDSIFGELFLDDLNGKIESDKISYKEIQLEGKIKKIAKNTRTDIQKRKLRHKIMQKKKRILTKKGLYISTL